MPYRSAILAALEDLKDHQTGSPASSIRRRMLDRAAAVAKSKAAASVALVPPAVAPAAPCDVAGGIFVVDYEDGRRHRRQQYPREEPPKGLPKRKTFRAKITMADMGDTISAVVPPPRDDTMMETDDDRGAAVVKIVPRRVSPRRMYVDVFRFARCVYVCVCCVFVCTRSRRRDWDGYCDNGTSKKY